MSTTQKLAKAIGAKSANAVVEKRENPPIVKTILSEGFKNQIATALPKHMDAARLCRIALTEMRTNPALLNCSQESFMAAVMQSAQLGLEPGSGLGQAYLIPYGSEAKLIIGYRGMIDLARRSGQVQSLYAYEVKEGDNFYYQLGLRPDIHHVPSPDADRANKPMTFVYAVANLKDGGFQFEVMSRAEIERFRKKNDVWTKHFEEMAKKTVVRRLFKYLPVSIEALQAVNLDAKREAGEEIKPEDIIDMNDFSDIQQPSAPAPNQIEAPSEEAKEEPNPEPKAATKKAAPKADKEPEPEPEPVFNYDPETGEAF